MFYVFLTVQMVSPTFFYAQTHTQTNLNSNQAFVPTCWEKRAVIVMTLLITWEVSDTMVRSSRIIKIWIDIQE